MSETISLIGSILVPILVVIGIIMGVSIIFFGSLLPIVNINTYNTTLQLNFTDKYHDDVYYYIRSGERSYSTSLEIYTIIELHQPYITTISHTDASIGIHRANTTKIINVIEVKL
jgi:lipopolysaccharide export LptBFGC system permease protein LptF